MTKIGSQPELKDSRSDVCQSIEPESAAFSVITSNPAESGDLLI